MLLFFLLNTIRLFGQEVFIQCSDGSLAVTEKDLTMLPALDICSGNVKKTLLPRYIKKDETYREDSWICSKAYMQQLITIAGGDSSIIEKQFVSKTFTECLLLYHDCNYLCAKNIELLQYYFLEKFYNHTRAQKKHWAFVAQHLYSEDNWSGVKYKNMSIYWISQLDKYNVAFLLCENQTNVNEQALYIYTSLGLFSSLKEKIYKDNIYLSDEILLHSKMIYKKEILDLSNLELTDNILYKKYDSNFCKFNNYFLLDLNVNYVTIKGKNNTQKILYRLWQSFQ